MFEENRFENVLKSLRVRKGKEWTQAKTARLLGVSRRTYVGWENGESIPSQRDLKNIATTLELNEGDESRLYHAAAQVPPEIHNLPLVRNTFFTGRKTQLEQLGQSLKEDGSVALTQPISISGLGGIVRHEAARVIVSGNKDVTMKPAVPPAVSWNGEAGRQQPVRSPLTTTLNCKVGSQTARGDCYLLASKRIRSKDEWYG